MVGADELLENRRKGYWDILDSRQLAALRKKLREHIYTDAKSVAAWIKSAIGVEYTPQGVADLLNRIGFTNKNPSEVPCEALEIPQEEGLNTGFYRTKKQFRQAVRDFFDNIGDYKKEKLESLPTLKFRLRNSQTISF